MRKTIYIIILLILIYPAIGGSESIKEPVTYRVFVDQYHGFIRVYEVYDKTSGRAVPYNGTLDIYKGDTVVWISDTVPDKRLTIISQQKLWNNNSADLTLIYKQFNYIFNNSGIYDIYIGQYPKFRQKIIVGPIEPNIDIDTSKTLKAKTGPNSNVLKLNSTKMKANLSKEKNSTNLTYIENGKTWTKYLIILPISIIIYILRRKKEKNK